MMLNKTFQDLVQITVKLTSEQDIAQLFNVSCKTVHGWANGSELPSWTSNGCVASKMICFLKSKIVDNQPKTK